jgi:hypothetical protein
MEEKRERKQEGDVFRLYMVNSANAYLSGLTSRGVRDTRGALRQINAGIVTTSWVGSLTNWRLQGIRSVLHANRKETGRVAVDAHVG